MASVEQHPYLQGQKAAEMLVELLGKKEDEKETPGSYKIIVDSQLMVYNI